jgi:hypothetical protein
VPSFACEKFSPPFGSPFNGVRLTECHGYSLKMIMNIQSSVVLLRAPSQRALHNFRESEISLSDMVRNALQCPHLAVAAQWKLA